MTARMTTQTPNAPALPERLRADDHLTYRDWRMDVDYGAPSWPLVWSATHKDFDASYEGEEDGWVGSHPCFHAATQRDLIHEIDCWYLDEQDARAALARTGEAK